MTTKQKWTEEDDVLLLHEVKESPYNLQSAFRRFSDSNNRSVGATSWHYYDLVKRGKVNKNFMLVSDSVTVCNYKTKLDTTDVQKSNNIIKKLALKILKLIRK